MSDMHEFDHAADTPKEETPPTSLSHVTDDFVNKEWPDLTARIGLEFENQNRQQVTTREKPTHGLLYTVAGALAVGSVLGAGYVGSRIYNYFRRAQ